MEIKKVVKEIYITSDGEEHVNFLVAERHEQALRQARVTDWLEDELRNAGGTYYDFSVSGAAKWIIENHAEIGERMNAA